MSVEVQGQRGAQDCPSERRQADLGCHQVARAQERARLLLEVQVRSVQQAVPAQVEVLGSMSPLAAGR